MKLTDCDPIVLAFTFEHQASGDVVLHEAEFEVTGDIESDVDNYVSDWLDENENYRYDDGFDIIEWDDDFAKPEGFNSLNEYGEYVEKCVEHGEGFRLRYEDVGDFDFDDEYNGCWGSEEEFIQQLVEDCYEIPDHLAGYIDWEKMTRDFMMDYSSYEGSEGYHIFRD